MTPRAADPLELLLGPDFRVPGVEAQTTTFIVYGGKGMGKTTFATVMAEEFARMGLRFSWLDPYGVAWGLKWSADGKGPGIEVVKIGGTRADIKLVPSTKAAEAAADFVCDEDVSVLIDISRHPDGKMWSQGERIRFVRDYCNHLFMRQGERRRPLMQFIDECGKFAPQNFPARAEHIAECLGAVEQLTEIGRNVGVGVALLTQRSARMAKSVSELADTMVAFRTVGPNSIDAIVDWFGEHVPRPRQKELVERIRQLDIGTALVVSPGWLRIEGEYAMRNRTTFDSSRTPRAGETHRVSGKGAQVDREKYVARMQEIEEEANANSPTELKKQLRDAKNEIARLSNQTVSAPEPVIDRVEVPTVPAGLDEALAEAVKVADRIGNDHSVFRDELSRVYSIVKNAEARAGSAAPARPAVARETPSRPLARTARTSSAPERLPAPGAASAPTAEGMARDITGPQQRILDALAWWWAAGRQTVTRLQLAAVAGYHERTKSFTNALSRLSSTGLVTYPDSGRVRYTLDAVALWNPPQLDPTTDSLQAMVKEQVGRNRARFIDALIAVYPDAMSREDLAAQLGYHERTKSFTNSLSALRSLGWIDYPHAGLVVAADALFLEAR